MKNIPRQSRGMLVFSRNLVIATNRRGDPWSPAEKRSFSDFPQGKSPYFRLTATDFA